ncbi:hypothetical protein PROAA_330003 [Candidatus Propionivibrio aalborgensis]|uniref:Uncharacterized protein n=1 Tax=Candidatus Propionivibrio aalborgensis TaxID=1860101 RepID=A0A1A8XY03_9RHOO|nr:hypothetical protein PROAA_330003 [Candidatus Propionivibrio aalborgensis]
MLIRASNKPIVLQIRVVNVLTCYFLALRHTPDYVDRRSSLALSSKASDGSQGSEST